MHRRFAAALIVAMIATPALAAILVNKTTLEVKLRGNPDRFDTSPGADWYVSNPSQVSGVTETVNGTLRLNVPQKYRKLSGRNVVEMNQAEKDAVDAAALAAIRARYFTLPERTLGSIGDAKIYTTGATGAETLRIRWGDGSTSVLATQ